MTKDQLKKESNEHPKKRFFSLGLFFRIVLASLLIFSFIKADPHFFNHFKPGFYFEKYDPKGFEALREELLTLHPKGSDVKALGVTLQKAGASAFQNEPRQVPSWQLKSFVDASKGYTAKIAGDVAMKKFFYTSYSDSPDNLFNVAWVLYIEVDDSTTKIVDITGTKGGTVK